MLTGISAYDSLGTRTLNLPVGIGAAPGPYIVSSIDGLGPVKAEILSTTFSSHDGATLRALRTGTRNIVFNLRYRPGQNDYNTVEDLRREMYRIFPPKNPISLRFSNSEYPDVQIDGIVESNEPVIFAKDPEVQISILCGEPNFHTLTRTTHSGSNASTTTKPPYVGSASTGFRVDINLKAKAASLTISNGIQDDIVINSSFIAGDIVRVITEKGSKNATLIRDGVYTTILEGLAKGDLSMTIDPRMKAFNVSTNTNANLTYQLSYIQRHMGL